MKMLMIRTMLCLACFALGASSVTGKQKTKDTAQMRFEASLRAKSLPTPWPMSIVIEELTTDEEMQALAQSFADGGQRALEKAVEKVNKGYCELGGSMFSRMPIMVVRTIAEGAGRRVEILANFPPSSPLFKVLGGEAAYPYVFITLEIDEHGKGKGTYVPRTMFAISANGQMAIQTRSAEPFNLVMVHEVK